MNSQLTEEDKRIIARNKWGWLEVDYTNKAITIQEAYKAIDNAEKK